MQYIRTIGDGEKLLTFEVEGREFEKLLEITRRIYSNSEKSKQFLKQNAFLTCFRRFLSSAGKVRKYLVKA